MENPFDVLAEEIRLLRQVVANIPKSQSSIAPELITRRELCIRLNISEPTAIRYSKSRKIPYLRVGNSIRYNWPKVVEALEKK